MTCLNPNIHYTFNDTYFSISAPNMSITTTNIPMINEFGKYIIDVFQETGNIIFRIAYLNMIIDWDVMDYNYTIKVRSDIIPGFVSIIKTSSYDKFKYWIIKITKSFNIKYDIELDDFEDKYIIPELLLTTYRRI